MNAESILNLDPVRYLLIFLQSFQYFFPRICNTHNKIYLLINDFSMPGISSGDPVFHLNIHRVKISRCCHYIIYVGNHLIQDFSHVIALFTSPYFLYKYNRQYNNLFPYLLRKFSLAGWPVFLHLK